MFYFFEKNGAFLSCAIIESAEGRGFEIVITEPNGVSRVERHATSEAVHQRWLELHQGYVASGWWGPHGRE